MNQLYLVIFYVESQVKCHSKHSDLITAADIFNKLKYSKVNLFQEHYH